MHSVYPNSAPAGGGVAVACRGGRGRGLWASVLALCLGFAWAVPATAAQAEARGPRILVLESMVIASVAAHRRGFLERIAGNGRDRAAADDLVVLEADGDRERAEALLRRAVAAHRPDVVVAVATLAAQAADAVLHGTDIPLVFGIVADPVGAGLIDKEGVPSGTNATGRVHSLDRDRKIAQVLRVLGPSWNERPVRFGIVCSDYPAATGDAAGLRFAAATNPAVEFVVYRVPYRSTPEGRKAMLVDARHGIAMLEGLVDFWWQVSGPLALDPAMATVFRENSRKPVVFGITRDSVRQGALLSINPDFEAAGRETADLVRLILGGAKPGTIPISVPERFRISINLGTAMALGGVVPNDLIELAGTDVFR